jgi:hypothetical protein
MVKIEEDGLGLRVGIGMGTVLRIQGSGAQSRQIEWKKEEREDTKEKVEDRR